MAKFEEKVENMKKSMLRACASRAKNLKKFYILLKTYSFLYLKDKSQTISQSYNCTIRANVGFGKCIQEKKSRFRALGSRAKNMKTF